MAKNFTAPAPVIRSTSPAAPLNEAALHEQPPTEDPLAQTNMDSQPSQTLDSDPAMPGLTAPGLPEFNPLPSLDPAMPAPRTQTAAPGQLPGMSPAYYQDGGFLVTFSGDYLCKGPNGIGKVTKPIPLSKAIVLNKRETLKELKRTVIPSRFAAKDRDFIRARLIVVHSVEPLPGTADLVLGAKLSDIRLMNVKELTKLAKENNLGIDTSIYGDDILQLRQAVDDALNANPLQSARRGPREIKMLYNRKVLEQNARFAHLLK